MQESKLAQKITAVEENQGNNHYWLLQDFEQTYLIKWTTNSTGIVCRIRCQTCTISSAESKLNSNIIVAFFLQKRHNKLTVTPVICDVLTFQWQVNCWRTDRQHQRHVSRLRYPLPSSDYLSARFARQLFSFFTHADFFLLFPAMPSLVPGDFFSALK